MKNYQLNNIIKFTETILGVEMERKDTIHYKLLKFLKYLFPLSHNDPGHLKIKCVFVRTTIIFQSPKQTYTYMSCRLLYSFVYINTYT